MGYIELLNKSDSNYSDKEYRLLSFIFPGYSKEQLEEYLCIDGSLLGVHAIKKLLLIIKFYPEDIKNIFGNPHIFLEFSKDHDINSIILLLNMLSINLNTRSELMKALNGFFANTEEIASDSDQFTLPFLYVFNGENELFHLLNTDYNFRIEKGVLRFNHTNGKQYEIELDDILTGYFGYLLNHYNKKFKEKGGLYLYSYNFEKIFKKIIIKLLKEKSGEYKFDFSSVDIDSLNITFHFVIRKKQKVFNKKLSRKTQDKKGSLTKQNTDYISTYLDEKDFVLFDDMEEIISLFEKSRLVKVPNETKSIDNGHSLPRNNITIWNDLQNALVFITNATISKDKNTWNEAIKLYIQFLKYWPQHLNHRYGVYDIILKHKFRKIHALPAEILSVGSGPHEEYRAWYDVLQSVRGNYKIPRITNIDYSKVCFEESKNEMSEDMRNMLNTEDIIGDMRDLSILGGKTYDMIECSSFDNLDGEEGAIKNLIINMIQHLKTGGIFRFMLNIEFSDNFVNLLEIYGVKIYHTFDKIKIKNTKSRRTRIFNNKMGRLGYFFAVKTKDIDIQSFTYLLSQVDVFKEQTKLNPKNVTIRKTGLRYTWKRLFEVKTIRKFKELVAILKESGIIDKNKAKILIERFIDNNRVSDDFKLEVLSLLENVNGISEILNFEKRFKQAKMDYIREIVHSNNREFFKYLVDSELLLFHEKIQIIDSFICQLDLSGMDKSVNKLLSQYNNLITYDAMYRHIHFIIYYAEKSGVRNIKLPDQLKIDMGIN